MNDNDKNILKLNITNLINNKCNKLVTNEKNIFIEYLLKTSVLLSQYYYNENFINQLMLNNGQDIWGLAVLLLPYFKLENISQLESFNEILKNSNQTVKEKMDSTYYVDHDPNTSLEQYLENSYKLIEITMYKISYKLMPNWTNIFPVLKDDLSNNSLYKDASNLFKTHSFDLSLQTKTPKIGYFTLYGTIYQFLYEDIVNIKWMIYDIIDENNLQPFIVYLASELSIKNIYENPYNQLSTNDINNLQTEWNTLIDNDDTLINLKSLLLFCYKRLLFNTDSSDIKKYVKNILKIDTADDDIYIDDEEYTNKDDLNVLRTINKMLSFQQIYEYIYDCVLQLSYTWYGHYILDNDNKNILDFREFKDNYNSLELNISKEYPDLYYISPKMIYNYAKNLIHERNGNKFTKLSYSNNWNELIKENKEKFISKLNNSNLSIRRNITRLYEKNKLVSINDVHNNIVKGLTSTDRFVFIIFETLVINGLLTEFKYNASPSSKLEIPKKYHNAFNFIDNTSYGLGDTITMDDKEITSIQAIEQTNWTNNFGANWICQIQQFHHFIHNRVIMVTGGTGTGKSSVYPMMMLYAHKMINFNNNAKIYCTIPRIKITLKATNRIAQQLGQQTEDDNNINYVQIQTSEKSITDNKYHPTLRFMTDGSLLDTLIDNSILKYKSYNVIDMVLVDEAHENNTNMNMILTLIKFGVYINNSVTLGIISATMEDDEYNYRKFYQEIDDNYKYPLDNYIREEKINRRLMDRRLHMGKPFQETKFSIKEYNDVYKKMPNIKDEVDIVKYIMTLPDKGDIMIFKPGSGEINELIKKINNDPSLPADLYAIPYYTTLNDEIKNKISNLKNPDVRNSFTLNKKIPIDKDLEGDEIISTVPPGTYKRFIIITTNIAEASETFETLSYVIDDGKRKIGKFNPRFKKEVLQLDDIATSNQKQRRGRVGRIKSGDVFYTYDITKLKTSGSYEITNKNNLNLILKMITTKDKLLISPSNDPYLVTNYENITENVRDQYIYLNSSLNNILYDYPPKIVITNIIYPYSDGKYDKNQLIDSKGIFYIVHPNEDVIIRDSNYTIVYPFDPTRFVISNDKVVIEGKKYDIQKYIKNKIQVIFDDLEELKICDTNGQLTPFGNNIMELTDRLFTMEELQLNELFSLLEIISFKKNNVKLFENLIHDMIINIIFIKNTNIYYPKTINPITKCDFLAISKMIDKKYYQSVIVDKNTVKQIYDNKNEKIPSSESLNQIIDDKTKENIKNITDDKIKMFYEKVLIPYNRYKNKLLYLINNPSDFKLNSILSHFDSSILNNFNQDENYKFQVFSYVIAKYYWQFILIKINETEYYLDYFERDINNIYTINYTVSPYGKKFISTYVQEEYRNPIYYIVCDDENKISKLMFMSPYVLKQLDRKIEIVDNKLNSIEIIGINPEYKNDLNIINIKGLDFLSK